MRFSFGQDTIININNAADKKQKVLLISTITGSTLLFGTATYFADFKNIEPVRFHFTNDFKGFLQVDKLVHSYVSYVASSIWYKGLLNAGFNKERALLIGGIMGSVPLTPKEIFDGFNQEGGFSCGDMLANVVGSAFFVSQELLFEEKIIKFKFSFSRSQYADQSNGFLGKTAFQSYFNDFNGHSYWLSINASKIFPKSKIPDWISLSAGYSANGMFGVYENIESFNGVIIPETQRYRQFLLSPDIDWSKIKVKSKFLKAMLNGINFIKVPFPTIELNSTGHFKGYWLYF
jgi:hypothetical protein